MGGGAPWAGRGLIGGGMHLGLRVKDPTAAVPQTLLQLKTQQKGRIFVFCSGTAGACLLSVLLFLCVSGLARPGADPVPKSLTQIM